MRVRVTVTVGDRSRYVIAKYFGSRGARATRAQVRAFVESALVSGVRQHGDDLSRRQRAAAARINSDGGESEPLREPSEKQGVLVFEGES